MTDDGRPDEPDDVTGSQLQDPPPQADPQLDAGADPAPLDRSDDDGPDDAEGHRASLYQVGVDLDGGSDEPDDVTGLELQDPPAEADPQLEAGADPAPVDRSDDDGPDDAEGHRMSRYQVGVDLDATD